MTIAYTIGTIINNDKIELRDCKHLDRLASEVLETF